MPKDVMLYLAIKGNLAVKGKHPESSLGLQVPDVGSGSSGLNIAN